ncbi:hypothetical protein [Schlesneria paludicola]|uniref:hypothetical protein n=1 Tax=Schlesneria paludicola TaxID=360056 RepID=UPI00029A4B59|nr:hypothetical protein [Schlesneria paludicola]
MTDSPTSQTLTINRALIGILSSIMLVSAGALWVFAGSQNMWTGACLKVGIVMAALWLALPTISRRGNLGQASWGAVIGFMALLVILTSKRVDFRIVLPMLIGAAIAIMILRPKSKSGPR